MKYLIVIGLMISGTMAFSQPIQNHFVYLQTENKQPFYVKVNSEILSSTSSGYLIVPKLVDSNYQFLIGFPANEWPEQSITLSVKKDVGFLLKNFEEKGWGLFDLKTFSIVINGNKLKTNLATTTKSNDRFSTLLSEVVNDSSILVNPLPQNKLPEDSVIQVASSLPSLVKNSEEMQKDMPIQKISSEINNLGLEMIYADQSENDTVIAAITLVKDSVQAINLSETLSDSNAENDTSGSNRATEQKKDPETPAIQPPSVKKDTATKMDFLVVKTPMINSNCSKNAVKADVEKLERKMVSENTDDDKLKAAKKVFKSKCFTTQYIRELSGLFITSAGKYNFFDMAYPYVSDSGLYHTLESEIFDVYYLKRFQALINK